ncbi:MAG TPA: site-specific DNA-methyltransferase, partial [Tissierellaceae bacterium]|nr:site-specific DNA-methyltransferase [Tissierellaceae bacterium]
MDNLELLKQMQDESVDLIYCDILYNTGRKFRDYDDNLGTPQEAVEWYRPRLIEMKRVLRDTGNIFLQCDYRLVHYLKVEMDSVLGVESFRNDIIWDYKRWCGKSNSRLQSMHDNILFYAKGNNVINHIYEDIDTPKLYQNRKDKNGEVVRNSDGSVKYFPQYKRQIDDVWHIDILNPRAKERVGYFSQKPK